MGTRTWAEAASTAEDIISLEGERTRPSFLSTEGIWQMMTSAGNY